MVRKYIKRDWTDHTRTTEYLSDEDEYIKFEIFSFDPEFTRTYTPEQGTLLGENCKRTSWRALQCFQSDDMINPMEFTLNYTVTDTGLYRVDLLYEQNSNMYSGDNAVYNTDKDLTGWYDIYLSGSKEEHTADIAPKKQTKIVSPHLLDKTESLSLDKLDKTTRRLLEKELLKLGYLTQEELDTNDYLDELLENVNNDIIDKPSTAVNIQFEGENNALKRKTIFIDLNTGDWKFEFGVPHNCYVIGAVIRKVKRYWGTNNDEAGSNLQFTEAKFTVSEMVKASELEATIGYDDEFEANTPSGLYISYMDECNLYVKNNEGEIERVFGGYVSTPLPDESRRELTIHCASRLRDGESKYILDNLVMQNGDGSNENEHSTSISFDSYAEALRYLCRLYEVTLNDNIDSNYQVEGEKFNEGFNIKFGTEKDIKSIPVTNGQVTMNKNSALLRNNSSGKKKQMWTLYDARVGKTPIDITDNRNLHLTYGLGNPKTEHKTKETITVDTSESTAGNQKFSKCGVSADKKYVMAIGTTSSAKDSGHYGTYYKTIFKNVCPHCKKEGKLVWDSCRSDTKCVTTGNWNGSKRKWGVAAIETEITCNNCDSDFSALGNEKDSPWKKLTKVGSTSKSSKSEQDKLHNGKMYAVPDSKAKITSDDIFKAIKSATKGWTHQTGTGSTATYLEKHGKGDCHAWSDFISKQLKKYKVNHKIVQYKTSSSNQHRSVLYENSNGKYVDFPYSQYGFPNGTHATSGSKNGKVIYAYKSGGRINQAVTTGSTNKSQTTETTTTQGFDKDNPIQGYFDIVYSTEPSFNTRKYHVYVTFTQSANSAYSIDGLNPVWVNNSSKKITFKNLVGRIQDYMGEDTHIYLQAINFITPKIKTTNKDNNTDWYTNDKSTKDNSSCKMLLYQIAFNNMAGTDPSPLQSCGKTVNEIMKNLVEEANYVVDMEYGEHRCDDKILFKVNNNTEPVFTATEGNNNNILEWGNINYNPANELFNRSVCVFKKNDTGKYYYVDSLYIDSILKYQEQTTLITETNNIGEKQAYWNARHNEKFNPEQTFSYTITVKGYPNVHLKELVEVIANIHKLNTVKECQSKTLTYNYKDKPVLQTEMGLGELAPDLQVEKNIRLMRDNAKQKTTYFESTATPINNKETYIWDN